MNTAASHQTKAIQTTAVINDGSNIIHQLYYFMAYPIQHTHSASRGKVMRPVEFIFVSVLALVVALLATVWSCALACPHHGTGFWPG